MSRYVKAINNRAIAMDLADRMLEGNDLYEAITNYLNCQINSKEFSAVVDHIAQDLSDSLDENEKYAYQEDDYKKSGAV